MKSLTKDPLEADTTSCDILSFSAKATERIQKREW
jgi:hypothetical protein